MSTIVTKIAVVDSNIDVTHWLRNAKGVDEVVVFHHVMDICGAREMIARLEDAINVIRTKHANILPDKTLNLSSGRSHA